MSAHRSNMNRGKQLASTFLVVISLFLASSLFAQNLLAQDKKAAETKLALHDGWTLQTSAKVEAKGDAISTPEFSSKGWHELTVPSTVVAALVNDKTLPE